MDNVIFKKNPFVRHQAINGVVHLVLQYDMFKLNDVGTRIWECIDGTRNVAGIVDMVQREYPDASDVADDVYAFVADLQKNQLIAPA
ncbi:pyrroloquinoline quinone biosynthesis peptide chaperone PqqD [Sulfobacillus thermosulfidooxidans]|uniref:pyrroloquinoline quinone biosynthesis peptide chaperone PqqD n=1 Tax=Sulfobacillus thermosulfidooxidans TaxID=28034 RepID=UPI0006B60CB7|nr:pyrroloquinoline quinone biosynthesis peptide chaperone PqqD [Sulfobacillus thermosulfidooxidans]